MEGLITELLGRLGSRGVLAALVFSIGFWLFADLHRQDGRGWWIGQLRHNSFERRYRAHMGRLLDQVDAFLAVRSRPTRTRRDLWQHFDDGALVLCLKASWGVSACSMLLVLVATGQGSRIARVPVIYSDEMMVRWIYGAVLAGLILAALAVARVDGFWRRMVVRVAVLVPLAIGLDALDPAAFRHRDSLLFSILAPLVGFVGLSL